MKTYNELVTLMLNAGYDEGGIGSLVAAYNVIANVRKYSDKDRSEFISCALTIELYQSIGKKVLLQYPSYSHGPFVVGSIFNHMWGVDFHDSMGYNGLVPVSYNSCLLGGVRFARKDDCIRAVALCGIDKEFQMACSKYGLGGA